MEERVGRYSLLHLLGRGGMGEVWSAFDPSLNRTVALKRLSHRDPDDVARFRREAQLAAALAHPNIAAIYEAGDDFIAMQFIDGLSLDRAKLSTRDAAAALRDASRAVAFAHAKGVIHRDLKPANVMIDASRRVFVMDFGLARAVKADASLTHSGMLIGTPSFMPPEQARGDRADARSDVYALGSTLYALVTGRPPFVGDSMITVLTAVLAEDPVPPRRLAAVDADIETIIARAMEKEPGRRYPSAGALADDLDRWLRGEPVSARRPSLAYRLRKRFARQPLPFALGALLAVALAAVPAVLTLQRAAAARSHVASARAILASDASVEDLIRADAHARFAGRPELRDEVNRRLGDAALARRDYALARLAFSQCSDPALARRVDDAELAESRRRRARLAEVLDDFRAGLARAGRPPGAPLADDYVIECVQYNDEQTVSILADALAAVGAPGDPSLEEQQLMTFCFRVLGRLGRESCVAPLARAMPLLRDLTIVVECGHALCNTRRPAARAPLMAARARLGHASPAWQQISALLARVPAPTGGREPATATELLERGLLRLAALDYDGCIADCTRALELDRDNVIALNNRAMAHRNRGDTAAARRDLERVLELDPRHVSALSNRGVLRHNAGDSRGALDDLTRAVEIDPRHATAFANRSDVRRALGDLAGAARDADEAIRLAPGDAQLKSLPALDTLDLYGSKKLSDLAALRECRKLRRVRLTRCRAISGAGLRPLGDVRTIEDVVLYECDGVTDDTAEALAKLPSLARLTLGNCPRLSDAALAPIAKLKLRALNLRETALTDAGLKTLHGMATLDELDLWLCPRLTKEAKAELAKTLPALKKFHGRGE